MAAAWWSLAVPLQPTSPGTASPLGISAWDPYPERRAHVRHALPDQHVTDCFLVYAFNPRMQAPQRGRPMRRIRRAGKTGRAWSHPGGCPGPTGDFPGTGNGRPARGLCAPGRPTAGHRWLRALRGDDRRAGNSVKSNTHGSSEPVILFGMILGRQRHRCGGKAASSLGTTRVREAMACRTSATGT